jgi:hypothetical protein
VNKNVRSVVLLDKTKPFSIIEPFDCTLCQFSLPEFCCESVRIRYLQTFPAPTSFFLCLI